MNTPQEIMNDERLTLKNALADLVVKYEATLDFMSDLDDLDEIQDQLRELKEMIKEDLLNIYNPIV